MRDVYCSRPLTWYYMGKRQYVIRQGCNAIRYVFIVRKVIFFYTPDAQSAVQVRQTD